MEKLDDSDDLVGRMLVGRYFLREKIGVGGMADVYLAWDQKRSSSMAIKVLHRNLARSSQSFRLFTQEADLLRKLEHPNIVRLYDFDKDGDYAFIVMDYVKGTDLKRAIATRKKPFSLDEAAHILHPVCTALHYAHQNEVYHCDIKPANILIHEDKRIFLSDFGVARLSSDISGGGTPPYMAPEQFSSDQVSAYTDIYALGITLYEMLSGGVVPFRGDTPSAPGSTLRERIAWEHLKVPPPPLSQLNPTLPSQIVEVIDKALSKNPSQRYSSALELAEAFELARQSQSFLQKSDLSTIFTTVSTIAPRVISQTKVKVTSPKPPKEVQPKKSLKGPYLYAQSGDLAGQYIFVPTEGLLIGRAKDAGLRLSEPSVSRRHASLIRTRKGVYIKDENSSLGTYVDGVRITPNTPVLLRRGNVIQVGYYQIFEFFER